MTKNLILHISIDIRQENQFSGNLHLQQDVELSGLDFSEMAKVLGKFNDLAENLKKEKSRK